MCVEVTPQGPEYWFITYTENLEMEKWWLLNQSFISLLYDTIKHNFISSDFSNAFIGLVNSLLIFSTDFYIILRVSTIFEIGQVEEILKYICFIIILIIWFNILNIESIWLFVKDV